MLPEQFITCSIAATVTCRNNYLEPIADGKEILDIEELFTDVEYTQNPRDAHQRHKHAQRTQVRPIENYLHVSTKTLNSMFISTMS